jgi:hypothetical protein
MAHARDPKEPQLTIKEYEELPVAAGASAQPPQHEPKVLTTVVKNWFPAVEPRLSVPRAAGYIVPSSYKDVVQTLRAHGLVLREFVRDASVEVEQYRVDDVVPASEDYVAPDRIDVTKKTITLNVKKGDLFVPGAQPAANLIPCLLEPQSEFGLIRYRAFKLIPAKGDVFPFVRVLKTAALPLDGALTATSSRQP